MSITVETSISRIHATLLYEEEVIRRTITGKNMRRFLAATYREIEIDYGRFLDAAAAGDKESLHHVYEWGKVGRPDGRLWRLKKINSTNGMTISFNFLQSRKVVPINPILKVPGPTGKYVKNSTVFKRKAWVLEAGDGVTLNAKRAKFLAIPLYHGYGRNYKTNIFFKTGPIYSKQAIVPDDLFAPGATIGQFTKRFQRYFAGGQVKRVLEPMLRKPGAIITEAGNNIPAEIRNSMMNARINDALVTQRAEAFVNRLASKMYD